MKTTINDYATIYPTQEGWNQIHTELTKIYNNDEDFAMKMIDDCTDINGMGYRDQLHNIMRLLVNMNAFIQWPKLFRNTTIKIEKS